RLARGRRASQRRAHCLGGDGRRNDLCRPGARPALGTWRRSRDRRAALGIRAKGHDLAPHRRGPPRACGAPACGHRRPPRSLRSRKRDHYVRQHERNRGRGRAKLAWRGRRLSLRCRKARAELMASAPSEPRPVLGRVDKAGRLISADPALEALQREAGSDIGHALALPQIASIAELARKLGIPVARPAIAASLERDVEMWVNATPEGDEVVLSLEGWTERSPAAPRLASLLGRGSDVDASASRREWAADEELRLISI